MMIGHDRSRPSKRLAVGPGVHIKHTMSGTHILGNLHASPESWGAFGEHIWAIRGMRADEHLDFG